MSAAPKLVSVSPTSRRAFSRHDLNVPLDVIVLRSGIPDSVPGRCTDLSEGGLGAVLAGELVPGQQVGLEFRLPNLATPLRCRAFVRYNERLHHGLQFAALTEANALMIRYWAQQAIASARKPEPISASTGVELTRPDAPADIAPAPVVAPERSQRIIRVHRRRFYALLLALLAFGVFGWWEWQRAWHELDRQATSESSNAPLRVAPGTMEKKILYRENPVYPESARAAHVEGVVLLNVTIAPDGSVAHLTPISGPEALVDSAVTAVRAWRFEPYLAGGNAVEVETTIALEFRLN